jgi:tetratricopeptide (TPR) repeat protein
MESVATRPLATRSGAWPMIDFGLIGIWALVGGLVLYLAVDGGGYGIVVHSQVGILVWWAVLVGAVWGLLPATRLSRAGWSALALFGGFVAWTALGVTWSISSERSLADLSLLVGYLGVLVLGLSLHRDRDRALRHTIAALAAAIVIVAILAVASRLDPGLFPASSQTASFLPGTSQRLAWPLNYWNALAALMAFGLPLLLVLATTARTLYGQAAAAAAIPIVALCGYLTFSRGGALAAAIAVAAFIALAPERLPKLATMLLTAGASAALIAGASHRSAVEHGFLNAAASHQGASFVLPILLVCLGAALAQVGLGLAARHGSPPRFLTPSPQRARWLLAGAVAALVVAALAAGAPAKLSHAWRDFKRPAAAALSQASISRFSTVNSNGRYELWKGAIHATQDHVLVGSGAGTFQLLWLPRAPRSVGYVENAHSLYFETLAELGVIGLVLLVAFLGTAVGCAIALVVRSRHEARARGAAAAAALTAFVVSAAFDWVWQVPVLPVAFLLLTAAVLAPGLRRTTAARRPLGLVAQRAGAVALALACLVAIAIPLATSNAVTASRNAAAHGDSLLALRDAQQAADIEPGAASPQVQLALVEELRGDIRAALTAARRAARNESSNWSTWLIVSRLEAEAGKPRASIKALLRARSLNPNSPLFAHVRA